MTLGLYFQLDERRGSGQRRRKYEARLQVLRALLNTRGLPGDVQWSIGINSVPIVFSKDTEVLAAWRKFLDVSRYPATPGNEEVANRDYLSKSTTLIYRIARRLKFDITENDIQNEAYYAKGFVERDNLMLDSFRALQRIAVCQEKLMVHLLPKLGAGS